MMLLTLALTAHILMESTAYNLEGPTKHGEPAGPGIVAVDPRVIPLGSRVEIEGMGEYQALDTGKDIKGNKIDIWMPTKEQCMDWGRREVTVFIYAQKASRGGDTLDRKLGSENATVRGGDQQNSNPDGTGLVGHNPAGITDRPSIFESSFRSSADQGHIRQGIPAPQGHQDGGIPLNREDRWDPKGTRSLSYTVRQGTKNRGFGSNYRTGFGDSGRKALLHGIGHRHFARETRAISGCFGECETGTESDEVEECILTA